MGADIALTALYLKGGPGSEGLDRRRWPKVLSSLRRHAPEAGHAADCLAQDGLWDESRALQTVALEFARLQIESDRTLSVLHEAYPFRWLDTLGSSAPPVLWRHGPMPVGPAVSVVGSRNLEPVWKRFTIAVGRGIAEAGWLVVSGGAQGADKAAAAGARAAGGHVVELMPHGISDIKVREGTTSLSACEPGAAFTTGQAMERNALIYAWSGKAVAVRPRFRAGGTWHGAVDALRRRIAGVWVADHEGSAASRALCALGANLFLSEADLPKVLKSEPPVCQPALFGLSWVREARGSYSDAGVPTDEPFLP